MTMAAVATARMTRRAMTTAVAGTVLTTRQGTTMAGTARMTEAVAVAAVAAAAATTSRRPRRGMTLATNPSPCVNTQGEGFVIAGR
jgi:hypothetical protein